MVIKGVHLSELRTALGVPEAVQKLKKPRGRTAIRPLVLVLGLARPILKLY